MYNGRCDERKKTKRRRKKQQLNSSVGGMTQRESEKEKKRRKSKELTVVSVYLFKLRKQSCLPSFIAILFSLSLHKHLTIYYIKMASNEERNNERKKAEIPGEKSIYTFCFRFQEINQIFSPVSPCNT